MSQIKINSIANVAGTASTDVLNVINGSAKAWVNFLGQGSILMRGSYNVSSITDNGVGNFRINFTNTVGNGDEYCITTGVDSMSLTGAPVCVVRDGTVSNTGFSIATGNIGSTTDPVYVYCCVHR